MSYLISKLRKSRLASATLALILAFSVLLSTFSGLTIFANTGSGSALDVWDGTQVEPTKGGDGSAADKAILIETPEELAWVVYTGGAGKYYKLTNDLYLNDVEKINWTNGDIADGYPLKNWHEVSSVSEVSVFTGHIDGDGHTVYGMYSTCSPTAYFWSQGGIGLITKATNGAVSIKNLGIDKAFVHNVSHAAAIIGSTSGNTSAVTVDSCYVGENVTLIGYGSGVIVSTAVDAANVTVSNCYSVATLTTKGGYAGFMSEFYGSGSRVVKNSYNANGPISGGQNLSAGSENNYETVAGKTSANAALRTSNNMKGADVLTADTKMKNLGEGWTAMGDGKYPVPNAFVPAPAEDIDVWDGTTVAPTKGGDGSAADKAILIETPEEFAHMIYNGGADKYYKLSNDIYLNDPDAVDWTTGGAKISNFNMWPEGKKFKGTIDGDGYTVYGVYMPYTPTGGYFEAGGSGLISSVENGASVTIKNMGIDKSYYHTSGYMSAFIGSTPMGGSTTITFESCYVGAEVTVKGHNATAFVATGRGGLTEAVSITNCYSLANLEAKGTANAYEGLVGDYWSGSVLIKNSYNADGYVYNKSKCTGSENNYGIAAGHANAATTVLTADNMKGADVLTADTKMKNLGAAYVAQGDGKYPILSVFVKTDEAKPWDGTQVEPTEGGDGSAADEAIIIETAEEFVWVIANGGNDKYYKLAKDIHLNDVTKINWADGTKLDAAYTVRNWGELTQTAFGGTIDGDGHTIYGMYNNDYPSAYYEAGGMGLIKQIATGKVATLKNLGLDKSFNHSVGYAAGFVGVMPSGGSAFFENCYVGAEVTIKGHNASAFLATGKTGNPSVSILNCYSLATQEAKGTANAYAGLVGDFWSGSVVIKNSYNAKGYIYNKSNVTAENNYGIAAGHANAATTVLTADNMKGADVLTADTKMKNLGAEWTEMGDGNYPVQWIFSGKEKPTTPPGGGEEPTPTIDVWDNTTTEPTKGGDGSAADKAILIETPEEFAHMIYNGGAGKYYKLANDIYLNAPDAVNWATGAKNAATVNEWYRNKAFNGTIDGDGHTVYGMYINTNPSGYASGYDAGVGAGLIPVIGANAEVTVKNLMLDKAYVNVKCQGAAIVGTIAGTAKSFTADSVAVGADVYVKGADAGAFVAMNLGGGAPKAITLTNCYNQGTIASQTAKTGFFGDSWTTPTTITNCYNATGPISKTAANATTATNCYALEGSGDLVSATLISADNMKGADVLTADTKMKNLGEKWTALGDGKYPVPNVFATSGGGTEPPAPTIDVWDGSKVEPTGDGSAADKAIEITTPEQLAWVVANGGAGKYYKLSNDIYLNAPDAVNWATGTPGSGTIQDWGTILTGATVFTGHIDGDGHTIYGIFVEHGNTSYGYSTTSGSGLIGKATSGAVSIKNLGIDKAYVHTATHNAAFIGATSGNTSEVVIDSCYVGSDVKIVGAGAAAFIGIAVNSTSNVISNSYNLGTMEAKGGTGLGGYVGFISEFYGSGSRVVKNSYNANGPISGGQSVVGSENNYETVAGVANANATLLTTDNMKGADVLTAASKMPNLGAEWTEMGDGNYPVPWAFSGKTKPTTPPGGGEGGGGETPDPVDPGYWTGETAPTKGGDGSSAGEAILIETANEFAYVISKGGENKYYKLANDIYLNDVDKINWADGTKLDDAYTVRNWGDLTQVAFSGTIDGDGHTIYGMYTNDHPSAYYEAGGMGLIKQIATGKVATLKNLGLDKSFNHSVGYAAGFVGVMPSGGSVIFENCYVGADVTIKGHSASAFLATGKLDAPSVSILNCYSMATQEVMGTNNAYAGLVGDFWTGSVVIRNSYNAKGYVYNKSNVTASNTYGLEAGHANAATIALTEDNMKGADVLTNPNKMPGLGEEWTNMGDGKFPVQWIFSGKTKPIPEHFDGWDGSTTAPTSGGDGSSEGEAIVIKTAAELAYVIKNGGEGKYYKLANDIYLNNVDRIDWSAGIRKAGAENYVINYWFTRNDVEPFYGTIDGAGHTIYGLLANEFTGAYSENAASGTALIPKAISGKDITIKNLGIDSSYIHSSTNAAAFVGYTQGAGTTITFDRCYVGKNVTVAGKQAAAFVGASTFKPELSEDQRKAPNIVISSCFNLGTLTKEGTGNSFYGFVGDSWGGPVSVTKSYNATGPIYEKNSYGISANNYETVAGSAAMKAELRTQENMKGLDVLTNFDKMTKLGKQYVPVDNDYPKFTDVPAVDTTWDGSQTEPKDTDDDGIIEINNASELAWVAYNGGAGKKYELTADIYLNDVSRANWELYDVNPWFTASIYTDAARAFNGTLEGNGHTIYGLYRNDTVPTCTDQKQNWKDGGLGLFPILSTDAVIRNVHIREAKLSANAAVGAFGGKTHRFADTDKEKNAQIIGCSVDETVSIHGWIVGGFVGGSSDCGVDIFYSSMTGKVTNSGLEGFANAFIGDIWTSVCKINNSYYVGDNGAKGAFAYTNVFGTATTKDEFGLTIVALADMLGENAKTSMKKLDWTVWYTVDGKTPQLNVLPEGKLPAGEGDGGPELVVTEPTKGGDGSSADKAIVIETASELAYVIKTGGQGKYYKLSKDIYINDINKVDFTTGESNSLDYAVTYWFQRADVEPFFGHIDGDGHTVYGLVALDMNGKYAESVSGGTGLIPKATAGKDITIKNLAIDYAFVNSSSNAGAFIGIAQGPENNIIFDRCYVGKNVLVMGNHAAAFVGASTFNPEAEVPEGEELDTRTPAITISSCFNLGTLTKMGTGRNTFSGFVGDSWGGPVGVTKSYNATGPIYQKSTRGTCANNYETEASHATVKAELRTPDNMKGLDVLTNFDKMTKLGKQYVPVENDYPKFTDKPVVDKTWDGFTRNEPKDTDGDGVFEIGTGEELAYVAYTGGAGKKYVLTDDIYLNDVSRANWELYDVNPWFTASIYSAASSAFNGTLEGNGHTIYGLYRNDAVPECKDQKQNWKESGLGLFPILSTDAVIRNVHIREAKLSANAAVGAFGGKTYRFDGKTDEGKAKKALIIGCSVDESVSLHGWIVGGFVGGSSDCGVDIYYSYMTGKYSNSGLEGFANAFIGDIWTSDNQIIDCYYVGDNAAHGKFSYINVYGTGTEKDANGLKIITKEQMLGAGAKKHMSNLDWETWYTVDGKTPHLKVVAEGQIPPAAGEGRPGRKWYGLVASKFDGGTGTKADPYLIATPEQLAFLVNNLWQYDTDTYYKITHDIILNDTSYAGWEEEALTWYNGWRSPFVGHLDGGGHVISGLYINDETPNYSALFPIMSHDSSIKKLGIINSKIISSDSGDAAMCAALVAFVEHWAPSKNPQYKMPVISECFSDESVYIEGSNVGGLVAGQPSPIKLENCYSTAELFAASSKSRGVLIGGAWGNDGGPTLINCYGTNTNRDRLVAGNGGSAGYFVSGSSSAENCYIDGPGAGEYIQSTIIEYMKGDNAKEHMPGLDYNKVWKTVKGGTPVLRCFKNSEKYSCKRELEKVNITFVTNGGTELEPMQGYPRIDKLSADDLPTPTRYGYKFGGWYYFQQLDLEFDLEVYPDFDLNLYAKWEPVGFTVTFENTPDPVYDYNAGIAQAKPGVKGYSPRYVHAGVKSMHTLPDSKEVPTFLLTYENTLEVGQEYEINFWVTTDTAKQSGEVRIAHAAYGDINDAIVGDEAIFEYSNLLPGVWKKYTAKFVANSPYILIQAPVGASLYFDDIQVVPTGEEGKLGDIDNYRPVGALGGLNLVTILIIVGAVLLLGAAAVLTVVVIKSRKAKKVDAE